MSSADPGGVDHVPTSTLVKCTICGAHVSLLPGDIVRRHLDPSKPSTMERADRVCPGSRGRWTWTREVARGEGEALPPAESGP